MRDLHAKLWNSRAVQAWTHEGQPHRLLLHPGESHRQNTSLSPTQAPGICPTVPSLTTTLT